MGKEFGENQRWVSTQEGKDNLVLAQGRLVVDHPDIAM
jgi:hypothetical protein